MGRLKRHCVGMASRITPQPVGIRHGPSLPFVTGEALGCLQYDRRP